MALIRDIQESRDPNVDTRIEVPNIRVTQMPPPLPEEPAPVETPPTPQQAAQQVLDIGDAGASTYNEAPETFLEDAGPHDPDKINELVQVGISGDYAGYRDTVLRQRRWQNQMAMPQFPTELYRPDLHGSSPIPTNPSHDTPFANLGDGLTDEMFQQFSNQIKLGHSPDTVGSGGLQITTGGNSLSNVTERVAAQSDVQTETPELYDSTKRTWAEKIFGFPTRFFMWTGDDAPTDLGERNIIEDMVWRQNIVLPQIMSLPAVLGGAVNRGLGHLLVNAPIIGDALVPEERKEEFLNDVFYNTTRNLSALFTLGGATERRAGYEQSPLEMLLTDLSGQPGDAEFDPLRGNFGEAGRGVGGGVIYGLQTPDDAIRALGQDIYELLVERGRSSGGTQSRNTTVESSGGNGLNHLAQALRGTEHSFMSPERDDGRGMGWTPIVEGEVGINLPGGTDDTILSWLPGSGTVTGFVLDALSELGVGTLLDTTATAIKKSQPSATTVTRSLVPTDDGVVSVLRDPETQNIIPPTPPPGLAPRPVRATDLIPLSELQQQLTVPQVRTELAGTLAPVNRQTALDGAALIHANMDAELLGQQRRVVQGEVQLLQQLIRDTQMQVRDTYQLQRQPLNIGTHETNTNALRVSEAIDRSPLARLEQQYTTIDVEAVDVNDVSPRTPELQSRDLSVEADLRRTRMYPTLNASVTVDGGLANEAELSAFYTREGDHLINHYLRQGVVDEQALDALNRENGTGFIADDIPHLAQDFIQLVDELPPAVEPEVNRTTPNASGTRLTRAERRAQSAAGTSNIDTDLSRQLDDVLTVNTQSDRSVTFFDEDGVESFLTKSYYMDDTLVWAFQINGSWYAGDTPSTPAIRGAVKRLFQVWDNTVRPVLDQKMDDGIYTIATAAAKSREELLSKWRSYENRGFFLTDIPDSSDFAKANPSIDFDSIRLVDPSTVPVPQGETFSPFTQQMMIYVGDRDLPIYRAGTDEVVRRTQKQTPNQPPAFTPGSAMREATEGLQQVSEDAWQIYKSDRVEGEVFTPNSHPTSQALEVGFTIDGSDLSTNRTGNIPVRDLGRMFKSIRQMLNLHGDRLPFVAGVSLDEANSAFDSKVNMYGRHGFKPVLESDYNAVVEGRLPPSEVTDVPLSEAIASATGDSVRLVYIPGTNKTTSWNLYLGTKEANPGSIPTIVSPTSPTGNGYDLMPTPEKARIFAESSLPPDALKRGEVSEQGRVIPVDFTPTKVLDLQKKFPDSITNRIADYMLETYDIDIKGNRLMSGITSAGTGAGVLEAYDNAMRRAFGADAAAESQNFRNFIDEALIEEGYDAKVLGDIVTPLKPIEFVDEGVPVGTGSRYEQAAAHQEVAQAYGDASSIADAHKSRLEALGIAETDTTQRLVELDAELEEVINSQVDAAWKLEEDLQEFEDLAAKDAMDIFTDEDLSDLLDFEGVNNDLDYGAWDCL